MSAKTHLKGLNINLNEGKGGLPIISSASLQRKEPTTQKIKSDSVNSIMPDEKEKNILEASSEPSEIVVEVSLQSMNLIDGTARHLKDLMHGLTMNSPSTEARLLDVDRVNAACNCAKQISNLMRLKLDAIKIISKC